jgi:hypothetical protein
LADQRNRRPEKKADESAQNHANCEPTNKTATTGLDDDYHNRKEDKFRKPNERSISLVLRSELKAGNDYTSICGPQQELA